MAWPDRTVDEWVEELDRGFEFRKSYGMESTWVDNEDLFFNRKKHQDSSAPNIIVSTGDGLLSSLTVPDPKVLVTPETYDAIESAPVVERIDNGLIRSMGMKNEVEDGVINAYLFGVAVFKIGFDSEFGFDQNFEVDQAGLTMTQVDKKGRRIEFGSARPGMPWFKSCMPHDIIVPWGTVKLKEGEWIAHRIVRHIKDIRSDPKYKNKSNLQPTMSREDFFKSYTTVQKPYRVGEMLSMAGQSDGDDLEYVELFEIHDRRTGQVLVIATGHDEFLRVGPDMLQLRGLPFVELAFIPSTRSFWRTPDATYLRQAQAELLDISIQASKQRRLATLKFLVSEGAMDEQNLQNLLSTHVGIAAMVKAGYDLEKVIKTFQPYQNPQIYLEADQVRRNAREMVGMSRNQQGEYDTSTRRTATEASIVDRSAMRRLDRRVMKLADLYSESFEKINPIVRKYWKIPRLMEVVGPTGLSEWQTVLGSGLAGEHGLKTTFSENALENGDQRASQALQIFSVMSQDPTVDPIALRRFLSRAFNDVQFTKIFRPGVLEGDPNAALQIPMQQMSGGAGGAPTNGSERGGQAMSGQGMSRPAGANPERPVRGGV